MTARAHHFVPKCYLGNFVTAEKITVVDLQRARHFVTNPKNVAQERDFNRIDSDTLAPDALEQAYGEFESDLAPILRIAAHSPAELTEDQLAHILNLIALLAIRNPRTRGNFSEFQNELRQGMLDLASSSEERWQVQMKKMREAGYLDGIKEVPYSVIRKSIIERNFKFVTSTTEHAKLEINTFKTLLEMIFDRSWRFLRAANGSHGFITSDHPVILFFENRPKMARAPIGFGLRGTVVLFPISPGIALEGRFDGPTGAITLDPFDVGDFNARVLNSAHRQIYAANDKFMFFDGRDFHGIQQLIQRLKDRPVARRAD
ncbi:MULTISPECIES: DUF4238 domain-containing protein [unclassified Bradyrhizobium]|uniref:DUF4238 domain-containing protein n=1 Tax=unclassified Bradyrhizobium TaxID=2631580 RepID=UPI0028EC4168|nr:MULTISPECIES: DUF4238 domain-containing protein [unclassified Bradyrhizobium]